MESPEGFAPLQLGPLAWGKLIEWIQTPLSVWGTLRQWTQTPLLSTSVEVVGERVRVLEGIEAPEVNVADNLQMGSQVSFALQGGHQADWVNPDAAKEYDCPICMKVCKDAVMHACCRIFCEPCWKECQKYDARCPICRDTEQPAAQAYRCRKDIEKLQLRCPRKCGAIFSLVENDSLLQHLEECSFKLDGCNLELQETQETESELCGQEKESSRDHIAALRREVQVLTASREWKKR